jgi:hypothetical protein
MKNVFLSQYREQKRLACNSPNCVYLGTIRFEMKTSKNLHQNRYPLFLVETSLDCGTRCIHY